MANQRLGIGLLMPRACYLRVHDHIMDALIFYFVWPARKSIATICPCRLSDLDGIMLYLIEALLFPLRAVDGVPFKVVDAFRLLACTLTAMMATT